MHYIFGIHHPFPHNLGPAPSPILNNANQHSFFPYKHIRKQNYGHVKTLLVRRDILMCQNLNITYLLKKFDSLSINSQNINFLYVCLAWEKSEVLIPDRGRFLWALFHLLGLLLWKVSSNLRFCLQVQRMTDTKMFLLGVITLMVVSPSTGDKSGHTQNVGLSFFYITRDKSV